MDRLAKSSRERERLDAERRDGILERCSDRLREELWQRLQVRVSHEQVGRDGARAVTTVEGLRFSIFVESDDSAHLQVQLPCPRCAARCWSVPVRNVDHLAALLAAPRFFTHDCHLEEARSW